MSEAKVIGSIPCASCGAATSVIEGGRGTLSSHCTDCGAQHIARTPKSVAAMRARHPSFQVGPFDLASGKDVAGAALDWAKSRIGAEPVLIYATDTPESVKTVQAKIGAEKAGCLVEDALAAITKGLVDLGVGQLIVAGGETSGAVVKALGINGLRIGPEIDPGVPWTAAIAEPPAERPLALALKSGNFGTPDFFLKAWKLLQ